MELIGKCLFGNNSIDKFDKMLYNNIDKMRKWGLVMTLLILAAGMGSRFGGMKQTTPVGPSGEFIIDYSCYDAIKAGFDNIVFVIKRENYDIFRNSVGSRVEKFVRVWYAFQDLDDLPQDFSVPLDRTKPWGTAHAMLSARNIVDEPFVTINADDFYGGETFRIIYDFLKNSPKGNMPHSFAMAGYRLANTLTENGTVSRGICSVDSSGMLAQITERTKIRASGLDAEYEDEDGRWVNISGDSIASMNLFAFTPEIFEFAQKHFSSFLKSMKDPHKAEFYLPTVASLAMDEGFATVSICPTPCRWHGVTYAADRRELELQIRLMIERGEYTDDLWRT